MWTPKNYLHPKIIDALFMGGFTTLQVEFFGWLSYTAAAVNNSRNPVKAAHTILANASDPEHNMSTMLAKFTARKIDSIAPQEVADHVEADKAFDDLNWAIRDAITKAQMLATTYEDRTKQGISDGTPMVPPEAEGESTHDEGNPNE